jgi:hypothetical protein
MMVSFVQYVNGGSRGKTTMTPGQLVKAVAIALDVPEETVVQHDRNLAVAGLRTTGGRGRSAPDVTHRDAARLVASILGSVRVKDSASVVQRLDQTRVFTGRQEYAPLPFPRFAALPASHSFIDALTAIIEDVDTSMMFEDFPEFARRFGSLWIRSAGGEGNITRFPERKVMAERGLEDKIDIFYATAPRSTGKSGLSDFWEWSFYLGLEQERKIRGNCLMILGLCFQKGLPASREAAFRAWKAAAKKAVA